MAKITYTANNGTVFDFTSGQTVPETIINAGVAISVGQATNIFDGATSWQNAGGVFDLQTFAIRDLTANGSTTSRQLDLRFNQFKIIGSCCYCGILITPSSDGFGQGNVFPATAVGSGINVLNGGVVRAGSLYGHASISATLNIPEDCNLEDTILESNNLVAASSACCCPNWRTVSAEISLEAISGGAYTITVETRDVYLPHWVDMNPAP